MTVEHAVRDRLMADATVASLVADRVYQLVLAQQPTLPAIRIQLIDEPQSYHFRGPDGSKRARVQIDSFGREAAGYLAVNEVAEAVEGALSGLRFTVPGSPSDLQITAAFLDARRVLYEGEELRLVRVLQEFIIWSKTVN